MRSLGFDAFGNEQRIGTDTDGTVILETRHADAEAILKRNAQMRSNGMGNGSEMKLAASIPLSVIMKWKVEHGVDAFSNDPRHQKKLRQLLNDRENAFLRIWEGNI